MWIIALSSNTITKSTHFSSSAWDFKGSSTILLLVLAKRSKLNSLSNDWLLPNAALNVASDSRRGDGEYDCDILLIYSNTIPIHTITYYRVCTNWNWWSNRYRDFRKAFCWAGRWIHSNSLSWQQKWRWFLCVRKIHKTGHSFHVLPALGWGCSPVTQNISSYELHYSIFSFYKITEVYM